MSQAIEPDAVLAYFYFEQQIEQTLTPMTIIGCLASQIVQRLGRIPVLVKKLFKESSAAGRPDRAVIEKHSLQCWR